MQCLDCMHDQPHLAFHNGRIEPIEDRWERMVAGTPWVASCTVTVDADAVETCSGPEAADALAYAAFGDHGTREFFTHVRFHKHDEDQIVVHLLVELYARSSRRPPGPRGGRARPAHDHLARRGVPPAGRDRRRASPLAGPAQGRVPAACDERTRMAAGPMALVGRRLRAWLVEPRRPLRRRGLGAAGDAAHARARSSAAPAAAAAPAGAGGCPAPAVAAAPVPGARPPPPAAHAAHVPDPAGDGARRLQRDRRHCRGAGRRGRRRTSPPGREADVAADRTGRAQRAPGCASHRPGRAGGAGWRARAGRHRRAGTAAAAGARRARPLAGAGRRHLQRRHEGGPRRVPDREGDRGHGHRRRADRGGAAQGAHAMGVDPRADHPAGAGRRRGRRAAARERGRAVPPHPDRRGAAIRGPAGLTRGTVVDGPGRRRRAGARLRPPASPQRCSRCSTSMRTA